MAAPVLGEDFLLEGQWVASGVVWLDWDDVDAASGFELMLRSADGWVLLSDGEPVGGVAAAFDGSSARVVGLPEGTAEYWFAVRARSVGGVSAWSHSTGVAVPEYAQAGPPGEVLFDPFTAPTRSGIDLERLREAVATITPGQADCSTVPALDVAGIAVVDPPAGLNDPDAELTVAEVARVAGGCLVVEHVALAGRTVAQVRGLLAGDDTVLAVGEPIRGLRPEHDGMGSDDDSAHYDDGGAPQWHLTPDVTALWAGWDSEVPVTVAVLDTGVDTGHPDLDDNVAAGSAGGCHIVDDNGHGTHVAGIVAAEHDPLATDPHVAGVAPDAKILPFRVLELDTCALTPAPMTPPVAVARAVNDGALVINMSISGTALLDTDDLQAGGIDIPSTDTYNLVLRAASMLGVVTIASAGNCGNDSDVFSGGETRKGWEWNDCSEHNAKRRPALYRDTIAVAAVNHGGMRRDSSTFNEHVDIAAPGGGIWSTGRCTFSGSPPHRVRQCDSIEDSGTSMAAPFVAGVVAHMLNRYPQATVGQVRQALEQTAMAAPSSEVLTRRGRINDPPAAPPSGKYGSGIVDPAKALTKLGEIVNNTDVEAAVGGFKELVAGGRHSCGLLAGGRVRCWGVAGVSRNTPGLVFTQVDAPEFPVDHACGVTVARLGDATPEQGAVLCWGDDRFGQASPPEGEFVQVSVGADLSCAVDAEAAPGVLGPVARGSA